MRLLIFMLLLEKKYLLSSLTRTNIVKEKK